MKKALVAFLTLTLVFAISFFVPKASADSTPIIDPVVEQIMEQVLERLHLEVGHPQTLVRQALAQPVIAEQQHQLMMTITSIIKMG